MVAYLEDQLSQIWERRPRLASASWLLVKGRVEETGECMTVSALPGPWYHLRPEQGILKFFSFGGSVVFGYLRWP